MGARSPDGHSRDGLQRSFSLTCQWLALERDGPRAVDAQRVPRSRQAFGLLVLRDDLNFERHCLDATAPSSEPTSQSWPGRLYGAIGGIYHHPKLR